jgi:hypothetical protein
MGRSIYSGSLGDSPLNDIFYDAHQPFLVLMYDSIADAAIPPGRDKAQRSVTQCHQLSSRVS